MSLPTLPTTAEIRDRIVSDIESQIGQTTPIFYKSFNRVIAAAFAMACTLLYKFGQWAYKQIFTATQDIEALLLKGEQYNIPMLGATACVLVADVTGDNGTYIEKDATFRAASNGLLYAVAATTEIISGETAEITLTCLTTGAAGTLLVDDTLTIMQPISGLDNTATVASITTDGEDAEDIEDYRDRIAEREKRPPQGGSLNDYILWAKEVPGVTRAFAWGKREEDSITIGHVEVYPLVDDDPDGRIPDSAKLAEVEAYIDSPSRAPTQAVSIDVTAMTVVDFTVAISALSPNTAAIRTAIEENITAYLLEREPKQFIDQVDVKNVISRSKLEAVCIDSGADYLTLALYLEDEEVTPTESYELDYDELCQLEEITFP